MVGRGDFHRDIQRIAQRKLMVLDAAEVLQDLRVPPGNRLGEAIRGAEGTVQYSGKRPVESLLPLDRRGRVRR